MVAVLMYPRPSARHKPITLVPAAELLDAIEEIRARGIEPPAIVAGTREWARMMRLPETVKHVIQWRGDAPTFARVPVVIRPKLGTPRVMANMDEMEEALLG